VTVEEAVIERLLSWPAMSSIVGTRIYQLLIPQSAVLPAVRVQLVDEPLMYHLRGDDGARRSRVQIDHYADASSGDAYLTARQMSDATENAISGQRFFLGSPSEIEVTGSILIDRRPFFEAEELRQVRMLMEFVIWTKRLQ
jgi:hypothetical protein